MPGMHASPAASHVTVVAAVQKAAAAYRHRHQPPSRRHSYTAGSTQKGAPCAVAVPGKQHVLLLCQASNKPQTNASKSGLLLRCWCSTPTDATRESMNHVWRQCMFARVPASLAAALLCTCAPLHAHVCGAAACAVRSMQHQQCRRPQGSCCVWLREREWLHAPQHPPQGDSATPPASMLWTSMINLRWST